MPSVILYTDTCSNCKKRTVVNIARVYAYQHNQTFIMRRVDYADDFRREAANRSQLPVPFVYNELTGKSVSFDDLTTESVEQLN